jgi:hypothetical protein
MEKGLSSMNRWIDRVVALTVPLLLLMTGFFFYFYFHLPEREADLFSSQSIGTGVFQASLDARVDRLGELHAGKPRQPVISPGDVPDVFSASTE